MNFKLAFLSLIVAIGAQGADSNRRSYQKSRLTNDRTEQTADKRNLLLAKGQDKIVDLDFDVNSGPNGIVIGNPTLLKTSLVRISGKRKQIVFKPLGVGATTVTVRDQRGPVQLIFDVTIADQNILKKLSDLKRLLRDVEGINFKIVEDRIVIDGEILVPNDYGRLVNVITDETYSKYVLNLAELSPLAMQVLSRRIQRDINSFAPNVRTRVVNGLVWLEGTVDNIDQARRASKVAELYVPELRPPEPIEKGDPKRLPPRSLIQNFIVINPPPPRKQDKIVRVTVHFVELSKDYKKVFGFKWQPGFTSDPQISFGTASDGTSSASGGASFSGTISSLFPKLQSAQDAGYARILKTGTVVVRSGKPATLTSETEIPFAVTGPNGQVSTSTAGVGLAVSITPQILGQSEDIEMDLDMTQRNLAGRTQNAPITAAHKVKTKLYVKSKESAAIAAVRSTDVQTNFNKDDPNQGNFSGNTSPLFTFLRSKSFTKKKSQFVVFVTPEIVENASSGTKDLKRNFRVKVN